MQYNYTCIIIIHCMVYGIQVQYLTLSPLARLAGREEVHSVGQRSPYHWIQTWPPLPDSEVCWGMSCVFLVHTHSITQFYLLRAFKWSLWACWQVHHLSQGDCHCQQGLTFVTWSSWPFFHSLSHDLSVIVTWSGQYFIHCHVTLNFHCHMT